MSSDRVEAEDPGLGDQCYECYVKIDSLHPCSDAKLNPTMIALVPPMNSILQIISGLKIISPSRATYRPRKSNLLMNAFQDASLAQSNSTSRSDRKRMKAPKTQTGRFK